MPRYTTPVKPRYTTKSEIEIISNTSPRYSTEASSGPQFSSHQPSVGAKFVKRTVMTYLLVPALIFSGLSVLLFLLFVYSLFH